MQFWWKLNLLCMRLSYVGGVTVCAAAELSL